MAREANGEQPVSRHHILPPVVYTPPPPKPKETRRKRGVGYSQGAGAADETGEIEETGGATHTAHSASVPQPLPVDPTERRIPSSSGKLSDGTLKVMLEAQEQEQSTPEK
jgi:hypothetical protein